MILSFGWTAEYLPPIGSKDTTRRIWKPRTVRSWQNAWDNHREQRHPAVNKCLAFGGERIGNITLTERPRLERLFDMPESDLMREGGMCDSVAGFIERYFDGDATTEVCVVRFRFDPAS